MLVAVLSAPVPESSDLWLPWILQCEQIIGADSGGGALTSVDRRLDVAIGDFDSWSSARSPEESSQTTVRLSPTKDDSDTDAAMDYAVTHGANEVWLFGGSGGRTDHWFSNWRLVEKTPEVRRWFTAEEVLFRLNPSEEAQFGMGRLSVLPLGQGPWRVTSQGLQWELDGVDFANRLSLSNYVPESATIRVCEGQVLVARELPGWVASV